MVNLIREGAVSECFLDPHLTNCVLEFAWIRLVHMQIEGALNSPRAVRFCALTSAEEPLLRFSEDLPIILLFEATESEVLMKIRPDWKRAVPMKNLDEIADLICDFRIRLKTGPQDLFQQACGLNIGPLITSACGNDIRDYPNIQEQARSFSPIEG